MAASSPVNIVFKTRYWVKKKTMHNPVITSGSHMLDQFAFVKDPIVQNLIDIVPSESPAREMMKFEMALNNALTTIPDRTSFTLVILPP